MNEIRIACCFMTYNHPQVIREILPAAHEEYSKYGIDLYFYDSSEDDDTRIIIEEYVNENIKNVFWVDVSNIKTGDEKYIYALQKGGLLKEYDYIWICKDRVYIQGKALSDMIEAMKIGYDIVMATSEENRWELIKPLVKDEYIDPVEFFHDYGQLSTNWVGVVRKVSTMVNTIVWDEVVERYNLGPDNNFAQTVLMFDQLAKMNECKIRLVRYMNNELINCNLVFSTWGDRILDVWISQWIQSIVNLPDIYDEHKMYIINSEMENPSLFGSLDTFIRIRDKGILTWEKYMELRPVFESVLNYSIEEIDGIMQNRDTEVFEKVLNDIEIAFSEKKYSDVYSIFIRNKWLSKVFDEETYYYIVCCLKVFRFEMNAYGHSLLFGETNTIIEVIQRYKMLKKGKGI